VAMKVVRAIAHDRGHKQTLRPSAGGALAHLSTQSVRYFTLNDARGGRRDSTTPLLERRV